MIDPDDLLFAGEADRAGALANGRRHLSGAPLLAAAQAREMLAIRPHDRDALRLLAAALRRLGDDEQAGAVELASVEAASHEPRLVDAGLAIRAGQWREAEEILRPWLDTHPDDAAALRMLAEIGLRAGARAEAERILREALRLVPRYASARLRLASILLDDNRIDEAFTLLDAMLQDDPENVTALGTKAVALGRTGEFRAAERMTRDLLQRNPQHSGLWINLGHLSNTLGDLDASIAAYRQSLALRPHGGVAWWSLANLKTFRFGVEDVAAMLAALERPDADAEDRLHLHFALGKAFGDMKEYEPSFRHYAAGNAIRHEQVDFRPEEISALVDQKIDALARGAGRTVAAAAGPAQPRPIFIVGMPRAGSTLIEQILASHSQIEGTSELPVLPSLVRDLEVELGSAGGLTADDIAPERLAEFGQRYLDGAQVYRKTDKPFFIDKLPNNWLYAGLIPRILPEARIIDARRHPLDCGWSLFKQNFARGQGFSYDLATIGRYYRDYVRFMAALDAALPGRVHRVIHEELVADSVGRIRAMLDYLGVPFEDGVLRHHETERAVRTPSAAQVRQPINRSGMEQWRPYEAWLGPLKDALGDVLGTYPKVPSAA